MLQKDLLYLSVRNLFLVIAVEEDPEISAPVNIGLPPPSTKSKDRLKKAKLLKETKSKELEKAAVSRSLKVPLDEIHAEWKRLEIFKQ